MRAREPGVTVEHRHARRAAQPLLHAVAGPRNDLVLARLDPRQIHPHLAFHDHAVVARMTRDMRRTGTRHVGLGRRATYVHAGSPEQMPLDHGRSPAALGELDA